MGGYVMPLGGGGGSDMMRLAPEAGGQNQYMNYPSMTTPGFPSYSGVGASATYNYGTPPGVVPPGGGAFPSPTGYTGYSGGGNPGVPQASNLGGGPGAVGASSKLPGGSYTSSTLDPLFTQAMDAYLRSQMGLGAAPFNLSAFLPSTGGSTTPGSVAAPLTPELQQLSQFLQTGQGGGAGTGTLEQMATTGMPTDVGPAWQAMIASQQHNIGENANALREQFAGMGALDSSPFGTAMSDFYTQTALGQNAQLTAAEQQAQEAAAGRMSSASQFLTGTGANFGEMLQGLDQQSIQALMQEYFQTSPDYSPLLPYEQQLSTAFAPVYGKQGFGASFGQALGGALGSSIGSFGVSGGSGATPTTFSVGG
jgi:hypothetical protein